MSIQGVDTSTGEVFSFPGADQIVALREENAKLHDQVERLKESLLNEVEEVRRVKARASELVGKRNGAKELDPFWSQAVEVYEYWKAKLCEGSTEMGEKRWTRIRARLAAGTSVDTLCRAIDGAALMPEGRKGRASMIKLEYICRHPDHVEGFVADAKEAEQTQAAPPSRDPDVRGAFLAHPGTLGGTNGKPATGFCMACAFDGNEGVATLTPDGRLLCSSGCTHDAQAEALLDWFRHSGMARCGSCGQRLAAA